MTGYVADLSWKSGARAIEKLDRLRSTMAVNVLRVSCELRGFRKAVSEDSISLGCDADSMSSCIRLPTGAASYPRPGLANFKSQDGHIIRKDSPEGHIFV